MSAWVKQCHQVISAVDKSLPADATLNDRRKALDAEAYWAHGDTSWGRKVWAREKKAYLQRHGLKPRQVPFYRPSHKPGPAMVADEAQFELWLEMPATHAYGRYNCAGKLVAA